MDQQNTPLFDLHIDHEGTQYLAQAAKWGRFISIIGFIFVGLLALIAIFAGSFVARYMSGMQGVDQPAGSSISGLGGFITIIYLLIAMLWFMPIFYVFRFSTKMQAALRSNDQQVLNDSFKNLKSCFRFMGIMTIIVLSIYVLSIIIAIAVFALGGH